MSPVDVCNGPGDHSEQRCGCADIPEGDCDCEWQSARRPRRMRRASDEADADADGICDDIDPCVGELDARGVCNGPRRESCTSVDVHATSLKEMRAATVTETSDDECGNSVAMATATHAEDQS